MRENSFVAEEMAEASDALNQPFWKKIDPFTLTILGAVLAGGLVGYIISLTSPPKAVASWISFPGELFLRALKCIVIPLIFTNMIVGCASISGATHATAGKIAIRAIAYYMGTTVLAATEGLTLIFLFQGLFKRAEVPGSAPAALTDVIQGRDISESILNIFRSLVPSNIVSAAANGDILAIISFALLMGVFIVKLPIAPGQRNVVLDFFTQINMVLLSSIKLVVRTAPICVFSMIAGEFAHRPDFGRIAIDLGSVILIVIFGLIIHAGVVYSSIYYLVTKKTPWPHYQKMLPAVVTAFGTSSSAVTFPITLQCVEEKLGVSPAISKFVLSLGTTINMDGTAIGLPVYIVYLARVSGLTIDLGGWIILVIVTTLGAIGASPIPNAGLVIIVSMWEAVFPGVPMPSQISWIMSIDWLLDRCETTVNVFGDSVGAAIVDHVLKASGDIATSDASSDHAESESTPTGMNNSDSPDMTHQHKENRKRESAVEVDV